MYCCTAAAGTPESGRVFWFSRLFLEVRRIDAWRAIVITAASGAKLLLIACSAQVYLSCSSLRCAEDSVTLAHVSDLPGRRCDGTFFPSHRLAQFNVQVWAAASDAGCSAWRRSRTRSPPPRAFAIYGRRTDTRGHRRRDTRCDAVCGASCTWAGCDADGCDGRNGGCNHECWTSHRRYANFKQLCGFAGVWTLYSLI